MSSNTVLEQANDRRWGQLAKRMKQFHDYFVVEFNELYELSDGRFSTLGISLSQFLDMADGFRSHLEMHHSIEESHIFPLLARRMPEFREEAEHRESHRGIHEGLDRLTELVKAYRTAPTSYSPKEFGGCLDSFREVLFTHLDNEVRDLGAENLRKHFTLKELLAIPM